MYNLTNKLFLALAMVSGAIAQVTETVTPNAEEYAHIKSDILSYHSALTTQSLYIAAESYLQDHSTTVPPIGLQLYTKSWSAGVSSLNALLTTSFPASYPTLIAELYHSALSEQANIINSDITHGDTTKTTAPLVTGTGIVIPSSNGTAFVNTHTPTQTQSSATSGVSSVIPSGAANAQMIANSMMIAAGFGIAILL